MIIPIAAIAILTRQLPARQPPAAAPPKASPSLLNKPIKPPIIAAIIMTHIHIPFSIFTNSPNW